MSEPRSWEVWWALVQFEDAAEVKRRPVVVLENGEVLITALKVTSHAPRNRWGEYDITRWTAAGLVKPSTVITRQLLRLEKSAFDRKIGKLDIFDVINIQKMLDE